jgi:hypothetical protein
MVVKEAGIMEDWNIGKVSMRRFVLNPSSHYSIIPIVHYAGWVSATLR